MRKFSIKYIHQKNYIKKCTLYKNVTMYALLFVFYWIISNNCLQLKNTASLAGVVGEFSKDCTFPSFAQFSFWSSQHPSSLLVLVCTVWMLIDVIFCCPYWKWLCKHCRQHILTEGHVFQQHRVLKWGNYSVTSLLILPVPFREPSKRYCLVPPLTVLKRNSCKDSSI